MSQVLQHADIVNCEFKDHFATKRAADARAKILRKSESGRRMRAYQCPLCNGWLLGHTHAAGTTPKEFRYANYTDPDAADPLHTL